ncbi:MAG: iron-sulfur cluster assembly accessory protein [Chloroflexi bacterium]|nr:iron-sulfur cluster assembly accessory protein [Chloroflexota bacterium]
MTTESIITLTPKAITKVEDILSKEKSETAMLRVVAMPSPGGSIQYMFAIEDNPAENDKIFEFENVKVLIDENSIDMIQGSEIDYIDSIMRSGFVISNPNLAGGCACGGGGGGGCGGGGGGCGGGGCGGGGGGCACGANETPENTQNSGCGGGGGGCGCGN